MTTKRFDLKDADKLRKHLGDRFEKAALAAVQGAALLVVEDIVTNIIPNESPPPVDRGIYRAGWRAQPTKEGANIVNNTPHAVFVEHGVRAANVKPGRKMIDELAKWAKRKGMVKGKGKGVADKARSIAFAIARNMQKRGIFNRGGEGLRILEKAMRDIDKHMSREIGAAIKKAFSK